MIEAIYILVGLVLGYFIANMIPSLLNPKEYMLDAKPANNFMPMDDPEEIARQVREEMEKQESLLKMQQMAKIKYPIIFKASRIRDPFTPDEVIFEKKGVTFKIKEGLEAFGNFILYSDISGVNVDAGFLFATIKIQPKNRNDQVVISNFTVKDAETVKQMIQERIN